MSEGEGVLALHAEPGEGPGEGHAWLTLTTPDGTVNSFSLRPEGGLCRDLEIGRPAPAVRTWALDAGAHGRLDTAVEAESASGWSALHPAAAFAAAVWATVTGEALDCRRWGTLPCAGRLAEAIAAAEEGVALPSDPTPRPRWSPTPVGDCVAAAPVAPNPEGSAP